jgi:hypothetical protein
MFHATWCGEWCECDAVWVLAGQYNYGIWQRPARSWKSQITPWHCRIGMAWHGIASLSHLSIDPSYPSPNPSIYNNYTVLYKYRQVSSQSDMEYSSYIYTVVERCVHDWAVARMHATMLLIALIFSMVQWHWCGRLHMPNRTGLYDWSVSIINYSHVSNDQE